MGLMLFRVDIIVEALFYEIVWYDKVILTLWSRKHCLHRDMD